MPTLTSAAVLDQEANCTSPEVQVGGIEALDTLAQPWRRLCKEAHGEPFLTPEWIRAYVQAFEPHTELVVLSVTHEERLLAILPLTRKWVWFRGIRLNELRGTANAHSVMFDVLREPSPAGEMAVAAIWRAIRSLSGWHVLQLPSFPEGGTSEEILKCAARDGFTTMTDSFADSPFVPLEPGGDGRVDVLAQTTRHFRHELRRFARLAETHGGEKLEFSRIVEADAAALSEFFSLEGAGWKGQQETAIDCAPETSFFYREVARIAAQQGVFSLNMLKIGGRMIAACFGVDHLGSFHGMKLAYDEGLRRCAPGHLLTQALLQSCAGRGLHEVSLGGKADEYKRHWTSHVHRNLNGFVFNQSVRSQIVHYERKTLFPALRRLQKAAGHQRTELIARAHRILGRAARLVKQKKVRPSCE